MFSVTFCRTWNLFPVSCVRGFAVVDMNHFALKVVEVHHLCDFGLTSLPQELTPKVFRSQIRQRGKEIHLSLRPFQAWIEGEKNRRGWLIYCNWTHFQTVRNINDISFSKSSSEAMERDRCDLSNSLRQCSKTYAKRRLRNRRMGKIQLKNPVKLP